MRSRIAYFLLILIAFSLNFPQIGNAPPVRVVRSSVHAAGYFFEWSTSSLFQRTGRLAGFMVNINRFENENLELKQKIRLYEAELLLLQRIQDENQKLRSAIGFRETRPYGFHALPSEVIGRGGDDLTVVVNKGEADGVKTSQTVVNNLGLVGRISEVSAYSSKVSLITDPINVISSVLARTGTYGAVRGGRRLIMDYVPSGISVEAGEKVAVSNASSTFLRGIPIGVVRSAGKKVEDLFQKIEIDPAVDFSKLDVVYICQP